MLPPSVSRRKRAPRQPQVRGACLFHTIFPVKQPSSLVGLEESAGLSRHKFVRSGAYVWVWDVDPIELDGAQSLKVDVTNSDQIAKAVAHVLGQSLRIDILVSDAGYLGSY